MIRIDQDKCTGCGGCIDLCPVIAISMIDDKVLIDNDTCTECKICVKACPVNAPKETD
jgi:ferredoxin